MLHAGQYRTTESQRKSVTIRKNVMQRKVDCWILLLLFLYFFAGGNIALAENTKVVSGSQYSKKQDHL